MCCIAGCYIGIFKRKTGMEIQYIYQDIKTIDKTGIMMSDGFKILFSKCNKTWQKMNKTDKTSGIGERDITADSPYFRFYMEDIVIEILFNKKGIFKKQRNENDFHKLIQDILMSGYQTFDIS